MGRKCVNYLNKELELQHTSCFGWGGTIWHVIVSLGKKERKVFKKEADEDGKILLITYSCHHWWERESWDKWVERETFWTCKNRDNKDFTLRFSVEREREE